MQSLTQQTGKYRCPTHQGCNANYKDTNVKVRFIDLFRFMPNSLEKFLSYLTDDEKFIAKKYCKNIEEFNLLTRKGVFPCDYIDSWVKLEKERLPPVKAFYSELNYENISIQDYQYACKVWETFDLKTLGEYSDLYLRRGVLLLADIFENIIQIHYIII